jgi:hypothetical protein
MPGACVGKTTDFNPPSDHRSSVKSPSVATAAEAMENYKGNTAGVWHNDDADPDNPTGKYAFQRLRHTWFTPKVDPKFTLRRDDKFYAIGSCFARGIEHSLKKLNVAVESAAPRVRQASTGKKASLWARIYQHYNTHSILNELRWSLDPHAVFP